MAKKKTFTLHLGFDIPVQHTFIVNVFHTQAHLHKPVKDLKRVMECYKGSILYVMITSLIDLKTKQNNTKRHVQNTRELEVTPAQCPLVTTED